LVFVVNLNYETILNRTGEGQGIKIEEEQDLKIALLVIKTVQTWPEMELTGYGGMGAVIPFDGFCSVTPLYLANLLVGKNFILNVFWQFYGHWWKDIYTPRSLTVFTKLWSHPNPTFTFAMIFAMIHFRHDLCAKVFKELAFVNFPLSTL
jgi:hypothetical protein